MAGPLSVKVLPHRLESQEDYGRLLERAHYGKEVVSPAGLVPAVLLRGPLPRRVA